MENAKNGIEIAFLLQRFAISIGAIPMTTIGPNASHMYIGSFPLPDKSQPQAENTSKNQFYTPTPTPAQTQTEQKNAFPTTSATTQYDAQRMGQEDTDAAKNTNGAVEEFLKFMNMTPEERMFAMILGEEGLTKEEFDALPLDQREKILQKVRERVKTSIEQSMEQQGQPFFMMASINEIPQSSTLGDFQGKKGSGIDAYLPKPEDSGKNVDFTDNRFSSHKKPTL
jgi:hypothetical protein